MRRRPFAWLAVPIAAGALIFLCYLLLGSGGPGPWVAAGPSSALQSSRGGDQQPCARNDSAAPQGAAEAALQQQLAAAQAEAEAARQAAAAAQAEADDLRTRQLYEDSLYWKHGRPVPGAAAVPLPCCRRCRKPAPVPRPAA